MPGMIIAASRRRLFYPALFLSFLIFLACTWTNPYPTSHLWPVPTVPTDSSENLVKQNVDPKILDDESYFWRGLPTRYHIVVESMIPFPTGKPLALPKIQASFKKESIKNEELRVQRQDAVRATFKRCWKAYREHAWRKDELSPISNGSKDTFGGWGATLVDSLDTLWIMGLHEEFDEAVTAAADINFKESSLAEINVFETAIRYLGGFLAAYDLSGDERLLLKAREVGDMLYVAFDTPNRMPITRWALGDAAKGEEQKLSEFALLAEVGSLCMEFTRLSLVTGNPKWFDATERIMLAMRDQQKETQLPGMWPITIRPGGPNFTSDNTFSLGAMADSAFEYLPKMVALTGGLLPYYGKMYQDAMKTAIRFNLFRPMTPDSADILISGVVRTTVKNGEVFTKLEYEAQHLTCYAGGMLALGGKLLQQPNHVDYARRLVDGCIWTYRAVPMGIMPESFYMTGCPADSNCPWDETRWKLGVLEGAGEGLNGNISRADDIIREHRLPQGFTKITDARYLLRPEAIESIFVLYRTTGDRGLLESAWAMFQTIQTNTRTPLANSALEDVTVATSSEIQRTDSMESFWLGETLKYFYLIFSDPSVISLDEYVFNTEAHPFRRLLP
ncbi:family 47 glycoside hydrolase [Xylariales sp. PMI_506]|nr:family 47 glycoside hydrolase [Xylariales sp. PMI_506]